MPDFFGLCIALLTAIGVICLVWMITGLIFKPRGLFPITAVIRVKTAEELTDATQCYDWMRSWGAGDFSLLILQDDLEPEAEELARLYVRDEPGARLCRTDELLRTLE